MDDFREEFSRTFRDRFKTWPDRLVGEELERQKNAKNKCAFGVGFLDKALGGINAKDLVLVGARTGSGKTELVNIIAQRNASQGKRVSVVCLEAEEREFEQRMKYRIMAETFYLDPDRPKDISLDYQSWYSYTYGTRLSKYEKYANSEIEKYRDIGFSSYRIKDYGFDELRRSIDEAAGKTDLFILDHFHYVDNLSDETDLKSQSQLAKTIRDAVLDVGMPIVCVVHLRKEDKKSKVITPSLEDIMGSSDIPKIATKAILISKLKDEIDNVEIANLRYPTLFKIAKARQLGSVEGYAGRVIFNAKKNQYEDDFKLAKHADATKYEELSDAFYPKWAR